MQETIKAPVRRSDGVAIVDLPAQIDSTAEEALNVAYADASGGAEKRLVLNFSGVDYLSSTGIALIVGILARSRKEGRQVAASGLSDHYREIFHDIEDRRTGPARDGQGLRHRGAR